MGLEPGTKLGPYEILTPLGAGGMGEVYRATDTRLDRDVAVKVLPAHLASDPLFKRRFEREARTVSSLNHPHICTLYDIGREGKTDFLVMEYLEGETLATRLKRGKLPLPELVQVGMEIADALDKAHRKGVVHRDLKPGNIMLTKSGAKLMDFGLAKPTGPAGPAGPGSAPLLSAALTADGVSPGSPLTSAGTLMGTIQYMSPEQIEGKEADPRSDLFALGATLYEMATGERAFPGKSQISVASAILEKDPEPISSKQPLSPAALERVVSQCLAKDPDERFQNAHDVGLELKWVGAAVSERRAAGEESGGQRPALRRILPWVVVFVVLICLAALAGWWIRGRESPQTTRWSGDLLAGSSIAFGPRISPDGRMVAFQAIVDNLTQVAVADPGSGNWTVLTHSRTRGTVHEIAWSPDGSKLYFDRVMAKPEGIYSVPSLGGDERLVLKDAAGPKTLPDGSLLIWQIDEERRERLHHFWLDSGRIEPLGAWIAPTYPVAMDRVFPDGKEAVFYGWDESSAPGASPNLYALDFASGKTRRLAPQLPIRLTSEGFPMAPTADNLSVLIDLPSGDLHQIVAIPRSGSGPVRVLMTLTTPPWTMDVGPDGSLYLDQVDRPYQILRFPTSGGTPEVLATSPAHPIYISAPVEFPDGRLLIPALDSGRSRLLIGKPGGNFFPLSDTTEENRPPATLLPGDQIAFVAGTGSGQMIVIVSAADGRISRRLQGSKGIYVTSLAASRDGQTLYYLAEGAIWSIPAADGKPHKIATGDGFAVDPNGKGLIINSLEKSGESLFRVPLSGGPPQQILIQSSVVITPLPLGEHSLSKDGKLVIGVTTPDSWFFSTAVLDLATGRVQRIPLNFTGDTLQSRWANDGRILSLAEPMQAHIWHFRPVASESK